MVESGASNLLLEAIRRSPQVGATANKGRPALRFLRRIRHFQAVSRPSRNSRVGEKDDLSPPLPVRPGWIKFVRGVVTMSIIAGSPGRD